MRSDEKNPSHHPRRGGGEGQLVSGSAARGGYGFGQPAEPRACSWNDTELGVWSVTSPPLGCDKRSYRASRGNSAQATQPERRGWGNPAESNGLEMARQTSKLARIRWEGFTSVGRACRRGARERSSVGEGKYPRPAVRVCDKGRQRSVAWARRANYTSRGVRKTGAARP
jgi:hypothetical protein